MIFDTLILYQNVSKKMAISERNNTIFVSFEKMEQGLSGTKPFFHRNQ